MDDQRRGERGLTHDQLFDEVTRLVEDVCDDPSVHERPDEDLFSSGLLDSMAAVELLVAIEDELGVSIAPTEVPRDQMNTLSLIAERVWERL